MFQEILIEKLGMLGWIGIYVLVFEALHNNSDRRLSPDKPPATENSSKIILFYGLEYQN